MGNLLEGKLGGAGGHGIPDSNGCLPGSGGPLTFAHNA